MHWSDLLEGWVLTRYEDVAHVLREPTISVELDNAKPTGFVEAERTRMTETGRKTDTLGAARRPRSRPAAAAHAAAVRHSRDRCAARHGAPRVDAALDRLVDRGEMDVIVDFAYPLPVAIFCEMLGIPDEASPRFRDWTSAVARNLDPVISAEERDECLRQLGEMERYLEEQVEEKRRQPADDIMTELVQAEEEGDRLTRTSSSRSS